MKKLKVWSPHKYLVCALRKVWYWSPERKAVLKAAQLAKDTWKCAVCSRSFLKLEYITKKGRKRRRMDGSVDHIIPLGTQPRSWTEYSSYLERLFCSVSNLQAICSTCHKPKSKAENAARRKK